MKRALVLAIVCALGLGVAAAAAPLTGSWDMEICFGVDPVTTALIVSDFDSNIGIDYLVGGWTFGMVMSLDITGMDAIYFHTLGSLGAFSFASFLDFCPSPPLFSQWDNGAAITLAGINLFALFSLEQQWVQTPCVEAAGVCSGFSFGGSAEVVDFSIYIEAQFGLLSTRDASSAYAGTSKYNLQALGFDSFMAYNESFGGALIVVDNCCGEDPLCCPVSFTGIEIHATYPFACFDMGTDLYFNCEVGFDQVCFNLTDIDLGTWFMISKLAICFTVQTKTVTTYFDLVLGETACFTPYFSLIMPLPNAIEGISFDAFLIDYSWNGVTFSAGHIFAVDDYYFSGIALKAATTTKSAALLGIDEFFAITAEGDSCCGGLWSASLINYLNSEANGGSAGIFGWVSTAGALEFGIASNLSITAGVEFGVAGIGELCLGFEFTW